MKRMLLVSLLGAGCITYSPVIVDRKTTLEQQAAGSYPVLATKLEQAGIQPGPVAYTRAQIESEEQSPDEKGTDVDSEADSARVDELLQRKCIGEGLDGTLLETEDTCPEDEDADEVTRLVERVNRNRRQVWAYLRLQHPSSTEEEVRAVWRKTRLRECACGAQVQAADSSWEIKKC